MNNRGRIEVVPTKPCETQFDLSLAYTPGVAEPCKAIVDDADHAYSFTSKGNLVGGITNGSAVPGLGDVGPLAAKPYMESLAVIYKKVADLDLFDIEINTVDLKFLKKCILSFQPTFGAFLLSGIKAPGCYSLLSSLKQDLNMPVMLEVTGVAVALGAALLNASKIKGKQFSEMRFVCFETMS